MFAPAFPHSNAGADTASEDPCNDPGDEPDPGQAAQSQELRESPKTEINQPAATSEICPI